MLTDAQREEFKKASEPLIKWLNENTDPHSKVIVECDSAELVSGEMSHRTTEFIKD